MKLATRPGIIEQFNYVNAGLGSGVLNSFDTLGDTPTKGRNLRSRMADRMTVLATRIVCRSDSNRMVRLSENAPIGRVDRQANLHRDLRSSKHIVTIIRWKSRLQRLSEPLGFYRVSERLAYVRSPCRTFSADVLTAVWGAKPGSVQINRG